METKTTAGLTTRVNSTAPVAVFERPANLAAIRTDPITYPHYASVAEKHRKEWLSGQIYALAGLLRIKDYTASDALSAATVLDGQIMSSRLIADYTLVEIREAFKLGIFGELGEWKGLTVQSLWAFLTRSLSLPVRQEAINAIYAQKQAEKARAEQEAIRAEIEKAKADGSFIPTGRIPTITRKVEGYAPTAEDLARRERVRAQAAEILARANNNNTTTSSKINW